MHLVAAEIGPRSGVGDDSEKSRAYGGLAVKLDGDRGMPAVGLLVELAQTQPDIERGCGRVGVGTQALDRPDHLGVEPEPGVQREVPAIGEPKANGPLTAFCYRTQDLAGGIDRVTRQPERAGEHVGAAARQRRKRRQLGRRRTERPAGCALPRMPLMASLNVPSPTSVSTIP